MVFVQELSDKTVTPVNSSALVGYLVHIEQLISFAVYWRWLIWSGRTLVGFLRMKMEICKEGERSGEGRGECTQH